MPCPPGWSAAAPWPQDFPPFSPPGQDKATPWGREQGRLASNPPQSSHLPSPPPVQPFPGAAAGWHVPGLPRSPLGVSPSGRRWACPRGFGLPTSHGPAELRLCLPHACLAGSPTALCWLPAPSSLLEGQGRVGEGWQPGWGRREHAEPRGPLSPLPGFASAAEPWGCAPGTRFPGLCPCGKAGWYGRGLSSPFSQQLSAKPPAFFPSFYSPAFLLLF